MTQPLQLSTAQLAQAEKAFKAKLDAKTLECASLAQLKEHAPESMVILSLLLKGQGSTTESMIDSLDITRDALGNYLSAKLNQAVIELQEIDLQLKAIQSMSNRIQPAVLTGR